MDAGRNDDAALQDQYVHSFVFQYQLTERTRYVFQNDLGFLNGVGGGRDAEWYGINQYLFYTINPTWSAGLRIEWFRDDDGVRVAGCGNFPNARGWMGPGGYARDFTELSLGLNWRPGPNIILRPEARWDWYGGPESTVLGGDGKLRPFPFDDGTSATQFTLAADLILTC